MYTGQTGCQVEYDVHVWSDRVECEMLRVGVDNLG